MQAKVYLLRVRSLEMLLRAAETDVKRMRNSIASLSAVDYSSDRVQTAGVNDLSALIVKLERYVERRNKLWDQLIDMKEETVEMIDRISDNTLRALLMEYYINGRSWEQVAILLSYSREHVVRVLHPKALREIEKHLTECHY